MKLFATLLTNPLAKTLLLAGVLSVSITAKAGCLEQNRLTGVNVAGAEFNSSKLPGKADKDYTYPSATELSFIAIQGANTIRLPFRWERLQPTLLAPLDSAEQARIQSTLNTAASLGLCVILDVHNYAKYSDQKLADNPDLQDAFVDLWQRIATAFPSTAYTAFGLMNEPSSMPIAEWATLAKRTLASLRSTGSQHLILVPGGNWSGVHDWFAVRGEHSNATAFADLHDPLKRTLIEAHQYADSNYSGTHEECLPADHFNTRFQALSDWAEEHEQKLFLGEFGMAPTPNCLATLERFLDLMADAPWHGWTYWAAGRWWGNYPFALNTNAVTPSPQWALLQVHFLQSQIQTDQGESPSPPQPL